MRLLWSGTAWDRLRLWTGLVLFAFVATHLLNHAVGLWSLEAISTVQHWRLAVTRSPTRFLVAPRLVAHPCGSGALEARAAANPAAPALRSLARPVRPGDSVPAHEPSVRGGRRPALAGRCSGVSRVLPLPWPAKLSGQTLLIIVVWLHGCLGLHYWLRGRRGIAPPRTCWRRSRR